MGGHGRSPSWPGGSASAMGVMQPGTRASAAPAALHRSGGRLGAGLGGQVGQLAGVSDDAIHCSMGRRAPKPGRGAMSRQVCGCNTDAEAMRQCQTGPTGWLTCKVAIQADVAPGCNGHKDGIHLLVAVARLQAGEGGRGGARSLPCQAARRGAQVQSRRQGAAPRTGAADAQGSCAQ